jgi:ribulose-5-phosphate 4-epimerase/fuculose-1-phosphate aldolase
VSWNVSIPSSRREGLVESGETGMHRDELARLGVRIAVTTGKESDASPPDGGTRLRPQHPNIDSTSGEAVGSRSDTLHDGAAREAREHDARPAFRLNGQPSSGLVALARDLTEGLKDRSYQHDDQTDEPRLVLNFIRPEHAVPFRRRAQATFVLSVLELDTPPEDPVRDLYPYLVRTLSNMLLVYTPGSGVHFVTLELGHYVEPEGDRFAERLLERIEPVAGSVLVINNVFDTDLEESLWNGDELTRDLHRAGRKLEEWDLLPAPFPLEEILEERDLRHVKRLYGIGGLSYGNLSVRKDERRFWMSASGVDKSNLRDIGRDILMVTDYDADANAMRLSIPPDVEPRRVSVDAIEHWMIYREHPGIEAIIHIHAWMEGIASTQFNYPCGTYQLGEAVAERLRSVPDPNHAVIGLKNHGITVTGTSITEILERIEGRLLKQIPMS